MAHYRKFVDIGDPHGDHVNEDLIQKLFDFMDDFQPDVVIHGGDNWDFPQLRKKASQKEKDLPMSADWQMGMDFLNKFCSYGTERYFLRGNHDERLWDLAHEGDGQARELADRLIRDAEKLIKSLKVKMLPYDSRGGVLDLGGLKCIHGYAHGVAAADKFARVYGTCTYHHTHSMQVGTVEKWPRPQVAYGAGTLAHIDQPYNSRQLGKLRHENGFTYGMLTGGDPIVFQARLIDGDIYATKNIEIY
jgi:hypothetical protein